MFVIVFLNGHLALEFDIALHILEGGLFLGQALELAQRLGRSGDQLPEPFGILAPFQHHGGVLFLVNAQTVQCRSGFHGELGNGCLVKCGDGSLWWLLWL